MNNSWIAMEEVLTEHPTKTGRAPRRVLCEHLSHPKKIIANGAFLLFVFFMNPSLHAQIEPPTIKGVHPLGLGAGETASLEIRGSQLQNGSLTFEDSSLHVLKTEASNDRIKIDLQVAADATPGPHRFRVVSPKGVSQAGFVYVGRPLHTVAEKEPNNGFRRPQSVAMPAMIAGDIKGGEDVDLFAVDLKAGQTIVAEAIAARAGSGLDPLMTIFSPDGRELAADDDLFGRDAATSLTAPDFRPLFRADPGRQRTQPEREP